MKDHMSPSRNYAVLKMLDPKAAKRHDAEMKKLHISGHHDITTEELHKRTKGIDSFEKQMKNYGGMQEHEAPHWKQD